MAANSSVSDRVFQRHGRWRSMQEKEVYVDDDLDRRFSASKFLGLAMQAISFYLPRLCPILCHSIYGGFSPGPPKINLFGSAMLCCYLLWSWDKICYF